jgi:hypothetical protein
MRLSLSSMRVLMLDTELAFENTFKGFSAASPYFSFFERSSSSSSLHLLLILLLVFINS